MTCRSLSSTFSPRWFSAFQAAGFPGVSQAQLPLSPAPRKLSRTRFAASMSEALFSICREPARCRTRLSVA